MVVAQEAVKKGLDKTPEVSDQLEATKQSVLANAYVQDFLKNNPVTDDMVKAEYERIKAAATGTEYRAHHILVAKEAEGKDIIARLKKNPGAFENWQWKNRWIRAPRPRWRPGMVQSARMVPEFGAAVSKLEKGKFTLEPVKTQFGYHVILLDGTRPIEPPPWTR